MKRRYALIAVGIAFVILIATLSFNYPKEDFSVYNSQWNGCSEVRALASQNNPTTVIFNPQDLKGEDRGALLLFNPNQTLSFSPEEIGTIRSFVEGGGSLFIANDFGNANELLDGLGIGTTVRFNGSLLKDDFSNWAGSAFPSVFTFSNSSVTAGIEKLSLNYATVLDVNDTGKSDNAAAAANISNVTVLVKSSPSSYLVADPSRGMASANATLGEKPVLASLTYGKGTILLCSDPSIFINGMIGDADNRQLFSNVIANLTNNDPQVPVFFDEAHRVQKPLLNIAYERVNTDETLKYVAILSVIGAFAALLTVTRSRSERKRIDYQQLPLNTEGIIDDVAKDHPGWSKRQLKKLLQSAGIGKRRE